jgi:hypothetical protein
MYSPTGSSGAGHRGQGSSGQLRAYRPPETVPPKFLSQSHLDLLLRQQPVPSGQQRIAVARLWPPGLDDSAPAPSGWFSLGGFGLSAVAAGIQGSQVGDCSQALELSEIHRQLVPLHRVKIPFSPLIHLFLLLLSTGCLLLCLAFFLHSVLCKL